MGVNKDRGRYLFLGCDSLKITLDEKTSAILTKIIENRCFNVGHHYQPLPDWMLKKYPEDKGKAFCTCCGREE
jgi:hypothetical protein